jgi:hypothetical protein
MNGTAPEVRTSLAVNPAEAWQLREFYAVARGGDRKANSCGMKGQRHSEASFHPATFALDQCPVSRHERFVDGVSTGAAVISRADYEQVVLIYGPLLLGAIIFALFLLVRDTHVPR